MSLGVGSGVKARSIAWDGGLGAAQKAIFNFKNILDHLAQNGHKRL
jgi:hypothetical protein